MEVDKSPLPRPLPLILGLVAGFLTVIKKTKIKTLVAWGYLLLPLTLRASCPQRAWPQLGAPGSGAEQAACELAQQSWERRLWQAPPINVTTVKYDNKMMAVWSQICSPPSCVGFIVTQMRREL